MKIVAGLGNPGAQYANTPHSVGFETLDALAAAAGVAWEEKRQFKCLMTAVSVAGEGIRLRLGAVQYPGLDRPAYPMPRTQGVLHVLGPVQLG